MTVAATNSYSTGTGNGVATAFPFTFFAKTEAEVAVYLGGALQNSGYTVVLNSGGAGGTVTFSTAPASSVAVVIASDPLFTQLITFKNAGAFLPQSQDDVADRAAARDIYLKERVDRAMLAPRGETLSELPSASERAGNALTFDNSGNPVASALTVTSAAGQSVSTRALLAAISTPAAKQSAILTESGREGTFVFDSSDLSAKVAADTAQGIYVAPSSDTTGASGAWVRKYVGPVFLEWFGGGPSATNNRTAFEAATSLLGGCAVLLHDVQYSFDYLSIPASVKVYGAGRGATTILITGDGGGAPSAGANGGVRMFNLGAGLFDLKLLYNNASLQCLLNVSHAVAGGRITVERVDLQPTGLTVSQIAAYGIYAANLTNTYFRDMFIGGAPNFKQAVVMRGFFNGCTFDEVTFQSNADSISSGVYWKSLPQVDCDATTRSTSFNDCIWEIGPNGLRATGAGNIIVKNAYMADADTSLGFWMPSMTVAQGNYVYPSAVQTTGSIVTATSTTTLNVASAANLYVNQLIGIPGAGAAGANLMTRISAISGTTVTIATAASTDVTTVNIYAGAYAFHGYRAMTAGTTGTSLPTFPTTGTVADNTTTWREYGPCAWINGDPTTAPSVVAKDIIHIQGGNLYQTIGGVVALRVGGQHTRSIVIDGTYFYLCDFAGFFDSVESTRIGGVVLHQLGNYGFQYKSTVSSTWDNEVSPTIRASFTGPSVVAGTNNANMGGSYSGSDTVAGIGKARWASYNPSSLAMTLPGAVAVTGALTGSSTVSTSSTITSNGTAGGVGYSTGAGSTIGQSTSKSTGVTMNRPCGKITMNAAALAASTSVGFTFTNSTIAATDVVLVSIASGATADSYTVTVDAVAAGSCRISLRNISGGSLSEAVVLNFTVIKAVQA